VNQTCTLTGWLTSNFRCGNTRTQLANWGTRISKVVPEVGLIGEKSRS